MKNFRSNSLVSCVGFLATVKKKPFVKFSSILLSRRIMATSVKNSSDNEQLFKKSDKIAHFKQDGKIFLMHI
jgi:hypothetical protein